LKDAHAHAEDFDRIVAYVFESLVCTILFLPSIKVLQETKSAVHFAQS